MTIAETIYQHSLRLPEHAALEALDFIDFLARRHAGDLADEAPPVGDALSRQEALARLDRVRIRWGGKPIANRDALYEEARGG